MAQYDSKSTEEPGQYPTTAWHWFGLPEQKFGSGAAGSGQPSTEEDQGGTNQPGQYPSREDFTGVALDGTGAPGTQGISGGNTGGSDRVVFEEPTFYKGQHTSGNFDDGGQGYKQDSTGATISGRGDWTQANSQGYQADAQYQMPGVAGNTPSPGDGRYQTDGEDGSSHVMYGGFLNGKRGGNARHPRFSGPGT